MNTGEDNHNDQNVVTTPVRNWLSIFIKSVLVIAILFGVLSSVLQMPKVQTFISSLVVNQILKSADESIHIGESYFDWKSGVQLSALSLTSPSHDTLAHIGRVNLGTRGTLLALLDRIDIADIEIHDVRLNIIRHHDETTFNWERFIKAIGAKKKSNQTSSTPIEIILSHLHIFDFNLYYNDETTGQCVEGSMDGLELHLDHFALDSLVIDKLVVIEPQLYQYQQNYVSAAVAVDTIAGPSQDSIPKTAAALPFVSVDEMIVIDGALFHQDRDSGQVRRELVVEHADIVINDARFTDVKHFEASVKDISFNYNNIDLQYFSCQKIKREGAEWSTQDLFVRLGKSYLDLDGKLSDFNVFSDWRTSEAILDIRESVLFLEDFYPIMPALSQSIGMQPIAQKPLQIGGQLNYRDTRLNLSNLAVWVARKHHIRMDGELTLADPLKYSDGFLEIAKLNAYPGELQALIPKFSIPDPVKRLGELGLQGMVTGSLFDFEAIVNVETTLGRADGAMQVMWPEFSTDTLQYAGTACLDSFHLGQLLDNKDLGVVSGDVIVDDGYGKDFKTSEATLTAQLYEAEFRDYPFRDASFVGKMSQESMDGNLIIDDPNFQFWAEGDVDWGVDEPTFDFDLSLDKIDFCAIGLTSFPCQLALDGTIDMHGQEFSMLEGYVDIRNIALAKDTNQLHLDSIVITTDRMEPDIELAVASDILQASFEGDFDLIKLFPAIYNQYLSNHQDHFAITHWRVDTTILRRRQDVEYSIELKELDELLSFLELDLHFGAPISVNGIYDGAAEELGFSLVAREIQYSSVDVGKVALSISSNPGQGQLGLTFDNNTVGKIDIPFATLQAQVGERSIDWDWGYYSDRYNDVALHIKSTLSDSGYYSDIVKHNLIIDSTRWHIPPTNPLGIFKKRLDIQDFVITDSVHYISINDIDQEGLNLGLQNFDLEVINGIINYDKLYFDGQVNAELRLESIFDNIRLLGDFYVPDFTINGEDYGYIEIHALRDAFNNVQIGLDIIKAEQKILADAYYKVQENELEATLRTEEFPVKFLEYIIDDGISETSGTADLYTRVYGNVSDLKLDGLLEVPNAGVNIDYTGCYYRIQNQEIPFNDQFIDLNGVEVLDARNNIAVMSGGLRHDFLADFRAAAKIEGDNFIALNTTEDDNEVYYGLAMGQLELTFDGPFDRLDMVANGEASGNSILYIPVNSTQYGFDETFINFNYDKKGKQKDIEELSEKFKSSGVNFEMNLSFTPEAEVQVLYDEETSNILFARGAGDIHLKATREGEITVYGFYNVVSGHYLYTSYGLIAKPFVIKEGGTVTWTGDPINANLNVTAVYPNLRASMRQFLEEFVTDESDPAFAEIRQRTRVDLKLLLRGQLYEPQIEFDLEFPELTGQLKSWADSKVNTLKSIPNGINSQAAGLMLFNNFLPTNNPFSNFNAGQAAAQASTNTVSEFLSSQLSILFTEYLSEKLEGGVISAVDFNLAVANSSELGADDEGSGFVPNQFGFNTAVGFENNNLVLNFGTSYVSQDNTGVAQDYYTGNVSIDWFLTQDRRLKLRLYALIDETNILGQLEPRQKIGTGIIFRKEFGRMTIRNGDDIEAAVEKLADDVREEIKKRSQSER